LAVEALGRIPTLAALRESVHQLEQEELRERAAAAAVAIAERMMRDHPAEVAEELRRVSMATNDPEIARRIQALLDEHAGD
jgi:hypothetical protein